MSVDFARESGSAYQRLETKMASLLNFVKITCPRCEQIIYSKGDYVVKVLVCPCGYVGFKINKTLIRRKKS